MTRLDCLDSMSRSPIIFAAYGDPLLRLHHLVATAEADRSSHSSRCNCLHCATCAETYVSFCYLLATSREPSSPPPPPHPLARRRLSAHFALDFGPSVETSGFLRSPSLYSSSCRHVDAFSSQRHERVVRKTTEAQKRGPAATTLRDRHSEGGAWHA